MIQLLINVDDELAYQGRSQTPEIIDMYKSSRLLPNCPTLYDAVLYDMLSLFILHIYTDNDFLDTCVKVIGGKSCPVNLSTKGENS